MKNTSKIFVLSPHIDDAAFALALTISQCADSNIPITIINCFTVTKWTAIPVKDKEISSVSRMRKNEDIEFYKEVNTNIKIINLDLLDAPLRNGYIFQNQPFQQNELELIENLKKLISEYVVDGILFCPLAIGGHIDHAICREAVVGLYKSKDVIFFEDLPYARRIGEDQIYRHIHYLENEIGVKLTDYINKLEQHSINKELAIGVYKSQINKEIISEIAGHLNALKGERLWGEENRLKEFITKFKQQD